jgi:uncharacterized protein YdeI (YjbR/CyaY-like superfamily)
MARIDDDPTVHAADAAAFEKWLQKNHAKSDGIWLALAKKTGTKSSVSYVEAVEICLCYGWIDGQGKSIDERSSKQRYTPRAKRSKWSKINTQKAERLVAERRMRPAGQAEINRAKEDGRWAAAYDSPSTMEVPDDLTAALKRNKKAAAFFDTLNSRNRYAVLFRIHDAKKPETRAGRVEKFVAMLERGETLY